MQKRAKIFPIHYASAVWKNAWEKIETITNLKRALSNYKKMFDSLIEKFLWKDWFFFGTISAIINLFGKHSSYFMLIAHCTHCEERMENEWKQTSNPLVEFNATPRHEWNKGLNWSKWRNKIIGTSPAVHMLKRLLSAFITFFIVLIELNLFGFSFFSLSQTINVYGNLNIWIPTVLWSNCGLPIQCDVWCLWKRERRERAKKG